MRGMLTIAKNSNNIDFLEYAYSLGFRDFRLNMDYEEAYDALENIKNLNRPDIRIFGDFQGVKNRIQLGGGLNELKFSLGDVIEFYVSEETYPFITNIDLIYDFLQNGQIVSIADGKIIGNVIYKDEHMFRIKLTKVDYVLRQNAGCGFIGDNITPVRMTKKACCLISENKIVRERLLDWIILSFVTSANEIRDFVEVMHHTGIKVMAKIETIDGVNNVSNIAKLVDGFMIGRGDLTNTAGKQFDFYYSKAINSILSESKEFSGVGTFFLSNFSNTCNLTKEERDDVEYIKKKGFDYIMLSKEVVNSRYPYETIKKLVELM